MPSTSVALLAPTALVLAAAGSGAAQPDADAAWRSAEAGVLSGYVQLTFPERFTKAGEAYFDPDARWIVFQAVPRDGQTDAERTHYAMYVAKLTRDQSGAITGTEEPIRVSPPDSANTCGWFHPQEPHRIIFGSTLDAPQLEDQPGYQRGSGRYRWAFPVEMEVTGRAVQEIFNDRRDGPKLDAALDILPRDLVARPLFERPGGYDAECAYSPDGRHIVFASIEPDSMEADLWVHDTRTNEQRRIVAADGYDGGPFFSPDGTRICYRSDRIGNNLLQLYVADLAFDETGAITGIEREHQVTDNQHVNWAPYWHPSGEFLVYATSEIDHTNYEVFAIEVPPRGVPTFPTEWLAKRRVTHAAGFDGLPVFSPDGTTLMWTSQRGGMVEGEMRPSSQVWIAEVDAIRP